MRIELDDNSTLSLCAGMLATLLILVAFNARACTVGTNQELTKRCQSLIESKADPVTINSTCSRVTQ
jgi:hypothetical protein